MERGPDSRFSGLRAVMTGHAMASSRPITSNIIQMGCDLEIDVRRTTFACVNLMGKGPLQLNSEGGLAGCLRCEEEGTSSCRSPGRLDSTIRSRLLKASLQLPM